MQHRDNLLHLVNSNGLLLSPSYFEINIYDLMFGNIIGNENAYNILEKRIFNICSQQIKNGIMMKIQQMDNNLDKYCYIQLTGLTTYEFLDILNYKLLKYKTYQKTVIIRYVDLIKAMRNGEATIRTTIEFAPLLLQHLREKKIQYSTFKMRKCREMMNINIYEKDEKGEKKDNRKWVGYRGKIIEIKASE